MPVGYKELLAAVSRKTDLGSGAARAAAEATVTAFARALDEPARQRFLRAVPAELHDDFPIAGERREWDEAEFVREVSLLGRRPPEQARVRAQAVLAAIAEQDPELIDDLPVPDELRPLLAPPAAGGGVTGATGREPPLTPGEVRGALDRLPDWSGDTRALRRTIVLPSENLDPVLERVETLRRDLGRGPAVRRSGDTAELIVRTASVGAVTALDVELATRLDELVAEAGAGIE